MWKECLEKFFLEFHPFFFFLLINSKEFHTHPLDVFWMHNGSWEFTCLDFLDFCNVRSWFVHPCIPPVYLGVSLFYQWIFITYQNIYIYIYIYICICNVNKLSLSLSLLYACTVNIVVGEECLRRHIYRYCSHS